MLEGIIQLKKKISKESINWSIWRSKACCYSWSSFSKIRWGIFSLGAYWHCIDKVSPSYCHHPCSSKPDENVGAFKVPDTKVLAISYYLVKTLLFPFKEAVTCFFNVVLGHFVSYKPNSILSLLKYWVLDVFISFAWVLFWWLKVLSWRSELG